jgi:zinc protease
MFRRFTLLVVFFAGALALAGTNKTENTFKINIPVEKYRLKNGLTVLLHQDNSAPIVSYQTYFRTGSRDEELGYTGIAHLFEHMMFKGAKRYKDKDFDKILRATGANYNAFTTFDMTGYNIDLPSHLLERAIDMESDRLEFLQLNESNLKSEREVVKEERRFRIDNSVGGSLFETMFGSLFTKTNYRWMTAGHMEDLDRITLEKCKDFFRQFYAPNNAIVIVSGDFQASTVKALIDKYYSHMVPQDILRPASVREPEFDKPKRQVVEKEIDSEIFSISYLTEPVLAPENFALNIVSDVLAQGTSSRLYSKMVRQQQTADSVVAYNYELKDAGAFIVQVSMKSSATVADRETAIKSIEGELFKLGTQLISPRELNRAKTKVMKRYVDSLKQVSDRARLLGQAEVFYGDYTELFKDLDKYQAVTAEDVQKVVAKYLVPKRSNITIMARKNKKSAACNFVRGEQC